MEIGSVVHLATGLSNQRVASEISVEVAKIANKQTEAQGQAALQLIESVPKPQGSLGHNINVVV